ncbi:MAG: 23S rRNA (adenine(2503)-C(2))-methyltransferase RlmN [Termitinemataceae bacterium]|nr:MAG: 23S rRNA (adenine(2503)-C(2))-methyltransferase RlmN [Termitinemataceae bacterium]
MTILQDCNKNTAISGLPLADLENLLQTGDNHLPKYRAKQIFDWVQRGVDSFDEMTNLSIDLRKQLSKQFTLRKTQILKSIKDKDGTKKLQIELNDGNIIESVILVDGADRKTACLSTQVGCPMACAFCKTGSLGFLRNLDSCEINEQLLHIQKDASASKISNIVFMGMGEPLLNIAELEKTLMIICSGMSKRRITISTCGIIDGIYKLADKGLGIRLAVSLTTADESLRTQLMPVTKKNPLGELKKALTYYQQRENQRITLECVLLGGINTRSQDITTLVDFAAGLDVIINLIPWNPIENMLFKGTLLKEPSAAEVKNFELALTQSGLKTALRYKKGRNVCGACGQLGVVNFSKHLLTAQDN